MNCTNCQSSNITKNGFQRDDKQKYKCKDCGKYFVLDSQKQPKSDETKQNLKELRIAIDQLDEDIQNLITERAKIAQHVAQAKSKGKNQQIYRPKREAEVLRNVIRRNERGPLPDEILTRIFREIMSGCLALQKPLNIAFLGPAGTYSQAAVVKHFGHSAQTMPQQTIGEVFREVEADTAQYGIVPIENSTEGGVNETLDCFINTPLKICGEVELPVHHHLLSMSNKLGHIKRIYAHQQSLAQCRGWLDSNLPLIECLAVSSNAEAAQRVTTEKDAAAIASQTAAEIYELQIVASRIEDNTNNITRFAIIGQQNISPTGADKTSLLLSNSNQPGALYHLLAPFSKNKINMTRIESRPARQSVWEYVFYIDIEGHVEDASISKAMQTLEKHTSLLKHLGSYPCAIS
jgi:chorismate mutase/prephenate dehydratase